MSIMTDSTVPLHGIFISILSGWIWGFYGVMTRYIMVFEESQPETLALLATLMSLNAVVCGTLYVSMHFWTSISDDNIYKKTLTPPNGNNNNNSLYIKFRTALWYGLLCLLRMATNMQSTRMTKAYNTQMVAMSLPFFTAILAAIILKEHIHWALMPALTIMLLGSVLVIYSQGAFDSDGDKDDSFSMRDVYGILLQLLSVQFSAGVKIALKKTQGTLDKLEMLLSQFIVSAIPLSIYTYFYQYESLKAIVTGQLSGIGYVCFFSLAFGVYIVGNYTQVKFFFYFIILLSPSPYSHPLQPLLIP
jgi:drug/metabolite transporter (DMT)-like permease